MGKKPAGEKLEKVSQSDNFRDGYFQNPVTTLMERPPFEALREMMKRGGGRLPVQAIETLPIDTERYINSASGEVLITWLGHSSFLMRIEGVNLLIDPVLSTRASMSRFMGPKMFDYSHKHTIDEFPPIDLVLLTHDHYDHLDYDLIKQLGSKVKQLFVPLGVGSHLEHWGIDASKVMEFDWWDEVDFNGLKLTATPGRHFTGRTINDRFKTLWCGWAIKGKGHNLYYSGDSGYYNGFKTIGERLGPFDFAMVECGQYSRFWPNIHLMPEESVQVAIDVNSSMAMPMHWGKFRLSQHNWNEPPMRFTAAAREHNLQAVIPVIGQTFTLSNAPLGDWWK
jgi:L-ascorbate metabolism protein UlaG (beta-lactamase superfamily)